MLEYAKLQIGCLIVVCYIAFVYFAESKRTKHKYTYSFYDLILIITIFTLIMDGATAVMVNHLDTVPRAVLDIAHMFFYLGIDAFIFCIFLYFLRTFKKFRLNLSKMLFPPTFNNGPKLTMLCSISIF